MGGFRKQHQPALILRCLNLDQQDRLARRQAVLPLLLASPHCGHATGLDDLESLMKEKKELALQLINAEQEAEDIKRDLEVKDVKIESL